MGADDAVLVSDPVLNEIDSVAAARILAAVDDVLRNSGKAGRIPELWDGRASQRIAAVLHDWLNGAAERKVA